MNTGLTISLSRSRVDGADRICCRGCGHDLGSIEESWKDRARCVERPLSAISPLYSGTSPALIREFLCPSCGLLIDAEVTRDGDPALVESFGCDAATTRGDPS